MSKKETKAQETQPEQPQGSTPGPGKGDPELQEQQPAEKTLEEIMPPELSPEEKRFLQALQLQKFAAGNLTAIPNPDQIEDNDDLARLYIAAETAKTKRETAARKAIPQAAEPTEPKAAETGKKAADQSAKVLKKMGTQIPIMGMRPQPPQNIKEEGSVIVAKKLAGNLGTAPEISAEQRIDERKFAVLDDVTLAALSHFSYRFVYDGVRYWGHIVEWWLTGSQGIGGLGRRHILQALANSSGVQSVDKAKSPNVLARNVWDRNWREKAESEGKVVEE